MRSQKSCDSISSLFNKLQPRKPGSLNLACYRVGDMATPSQLRANRLNARKSTGPRSVEGKAAVRFNALQHGLDASSVTIPGEDLAAFDQLTLEYFEQFQPAGPSQIHLVQTLIQADWMWRRYTRIEAQLFNVLCAEQKDTDLPLGAAFVKDAQSNGPLQKIFRRQEAAQRTYFRALRELDRLQQEEDRPDPPEAAAHGASTKNASPKNTSPQKRVIGFDLPTPPAAPGAAPLPPSPPPAALDDTPLARLL